MRIAWALAALAALGGQDARAYAGYEARASCQIGFGQDADATADLDTAFASLEAGVAGPSSYADCASETDAARGSLQTGVVLSQASGAVSGRLPTRGTSRILERIYLSIPSGGTATITASLAVSPALTVTGSGTGVAGATLDVFGCRVSSLLRASGPDLVDNCNLAFADADPATMSMTLAIPKQFVQNPPNNFVELSAQVEAEVSTLEGTSIGQASASGALLVSVEGATSWRFSNPNTLTVPEAGVGPSGAAALAALAGLRRRR